MLLEAYEFRSIFYLPSKLKYLVIFLCVLSPILSNINKTILTLLFPWYVFIIPLFSKLQYPILSISHISRI